MQHNSDKLLQWEAEAAHFHEIVRESKHTEAVEGMHKETLGGSVKADKQWIVEQVDDRQKQVSYMAEISEIEKILAKTSHSMETCHTR